MKLPAPYTFLDGLPGAPRTILEALPLYGIKEGKGKLDNPVIIGWAKEAEVPEYGPHDEKAWCGLFAALVVRRAGWTPVSAPLWATNWDRFGQPADAPSLGDVLTFDRYDNRGKLIGGHVGFYVGEDVQAYHVLGGNQTDAVSFARIDRERFRKARRPIWRIAQPAAVRPYRLDVMGAAPLSTKES